jgi:hypothetical protein
MDADGKAKAWVNARQVCLPDTVDPRGSSEPARVSDMLGQTDCRRQSTSGSGSWGGQPPSLADYVAGMMPTGGAIAAGRLLEFARLLWIVTAPDETIALNRRH